MHLLPAALLCLLIGWLVVCVAWPQRSFRREHLLLRLSLAVGGGLGCFSLIFFWTLLLSRSKGMLFVADLSLAAVLAMLVFFRRGRSLNARATSVPRATLPISVRNLIFGALVIASLLSLYGLIQRLLANPNGEGWDAFAIWNLHARFLFLGGEHWQEGFTNIIAWSHPDYPLLIPAAIAHFWRFLGRDSVAVPAVIALAFTLATVGILIGSLSELRGKIQASLAGIVLLGTPFFLEHGVSQYADVALGYFLLAAIVLLWFSRLQGSASLLSFSGLMAGFAAWTKNEGQLFSCAFLISLAVVLWRDQGLPGCIRNSGLVLAGMTPAILTVLYFKIRTAPPGDLFAGNSMLTKVADLHRYWFIVRWYVKEFFIFGHWFLIPGTVLILAYGWLLGRHHLQEHASAARISVLTLALTVTGYFAIFVITPYDLRWHLRYSLNRLFLHLWPSALFVFFMLIRTPHEAADARRLAPSTAE